MRFNLPLLLAAVAASAVKAADDAEATADAQATGDAQATDAYRQRCNADNCLRIIRGNQGWPPINKCQTDCSSYLVTTVTPTPPVIATYTVYAPTPTITVTATTTANTCSGGKTWCGGQCKDCNTDHDNCGKCGNSCKWGEICYKGKCKNHGTCQGAQVCPGWGQQAPSCGGGPRSNCQNGECRMCADGVGRCAPRSATPPNCWQQNRQRCNQNGDCPGGYCVRNCCGSYCYYPDNGDICDLSSSPYKLFRK
ncbi:hypothetical protein PG990_013779 [Apiospora arundinis]